LVWTSGGQTGASTISGNFEAFDFTKAGRGTLLLSGTANVMAPTTTACAYADRSGRHAPSSPPRAAVASGGLINLVAVNSAASFDLNGQNVTIGGLAGYRSA
jgi:hypothetical protein